jgi:hypothetical protein
MSLRAITLTPLPLLSKRPGLPETEYALLCRFCRDKIGTVTSERVQRRIERLLDQLEEVADQRDWDLGLDSHAKRSRR